VLLLVLTSQQCWAFQPGLKNPPFKGRTQHQLRSSSLALGTVTTAWLHAMTVYMLYALDVDRDELAFTVAALDLAAGQLFTSERGLVRDPWLFVPLTVCHILHSCILSVTGLC
jgi:hypothetical protein